MATANYDKFIELRKGGVDAQTARKQAYGDIQTAPTIQAQPVQPTGGATLPIAPQVAQPAETPTAIAPVPTTPIVPMVEAPRSPTTGLSAPLPTTPTPTTPTNTTDPAQVEREKISAQNKATLEQNKQQADLRQAERDKLATDTTNQLANNETAILNTLKVGGNIPPEVKNSPNFKSAQQTYNKIQQFSTYSTSDLSTALSSGVLLPGTNVYNEMMKDPAMKMKLTQAQIFAGNKPVNLPVVYENVSSEILSNNPTTANFLSDGVITQDEYAQATNNPEIVAKAKDVEEKTNKYNTLQAEYDSIDDEVKSQFPASPFVDSIIADRKKSKYKDLILAKGQVDSALGTLTELKSQSANLFETNLKLYESRRAEQMQIESEKRQQAITQENAVFNTQLGLQKGQAEFEQGLAQQAQLATDPISGTNSIINTFEKMGIMADRSRQEIIADVQNKVASGIPLGQALSDLQTAFKSKPEYQKALSLQMGQMSDYEKTLAQQEFSTSSDIRNFEQQKEIARMNNDMNRQDFLFELENDPAKRLAIAQLEEKLNANKSLYDVLGKNVGTYEGNRGYDLAGKLGEPLPAGGNWKVESIIDANFTSSPYGNSVVMVDENGNKIRYSHLQSIGVKPGDQLGFGDIVGTRGNTGNVRGANGETLTEEQLKAGRGAHVDIEIKDPSGKLLSQKEQVDWLKSKKVGEQEYDVNAVAIANGVGDLSDLTPTDKKAILPQLEAIVNSRMTGDKGRDAIVKSALYKKDVSDSTLQKMTDMQTVRFQLDAIESRLAKQSVGPILGRIKKLNPYDTEAQVALAELAGITPKVARGIFGEVGVLTDTDIENYQKTLPNLTSTEEKNKFVVEVMRKLLAKGVMNTIETQARGQRNVSPFLEVYDEAKSYIGNTPSTPATDPYESDWNDAANL